jgi:hypothetical protein
LDTLELTLNSILAQPHGPIYISCDGPPKEFEQEAAIVHDYVRRLRDTNIVNEVRISEHHLGTLVGISKGIEWFFQQVPVGIILEDDLVLESGLLETVEIAATHLNDPTILSINLLNPVPINQLTNPGDFLRRSRFVISTGWVTTKNNWESRVKKFNDVNMWKLFFRMCSTLGLSSSIYHLYHYLEEKKKENFSEKSCNWDNLWQINLFLKGMTAITYNRNMVSHIGYGPGATHTSDHYFEFPIIHFTDLEISQVSKWLLNPSLDNKADGYFKESRTFSKLILSKIAFRSRLFMFAKRLGLF